MNPLTAIFTAAFARGVAWHQLQQVQAGRIAETCLKADEMIVCRNATVMMDSRGHISYINNDRPPVVLPTGSEDEFIGGTWAHRVFINKNKP